MYIVRHVMRSLVLVALCAGAPYGPVLLPHHPRVLDYRAWFGRWIPEHSGP